MVLELDLVCLNYHHFMQKTTDIATYSWHLTDLQIFVFNRVAGS